MSPILLAGTMVLAFAAAAPVFSDTTPGLTTVTLAPGTYDIVATGAGGGPSSIAIPGGLGGVVEGTFTFATPEVLSLLVGGQGSSGFSRAALDSIDWAAVGVAGARS